MHIYQEGLPKVLSSHLKYLNKVISSKKRNWQHARAEIANNYVGLHRGVPGTRALLHTLHHYALLANIMLVDFKQTAQPLRLWILGSPD